MLSLLLLKCKLFRTLNSLSKSGSIYNPPRSIYKILIREKNPMGPIEQKSLVSLGRKIHSPHAGKKKPRIANIQTAHSRPSEPEAPLV